MATIAAIAGLAAAGASAYGAYSSNQNAAAARRQNALNIAAQRRQQELAEEQQAASLAPTTNARGDRTEYVPGVGWIETASPLTRALQSRSDSEEARRLAEDLPRQAMQREHAFTQQQQDRGLANALMARLGMGTRSLADVEADQTRLGVAQAVGNRSAQNNAAVMSALRQGTGAQELVAANNRGAAADTRVALEQARAGAPRGYADNESARLNDGLTRYRQLMGSALAPDSSVAFQPNALADALTQNRQKQQGTAAYGLATAFQGLKPAQVGVVDDGYAARAAMGLQGVKSAMQGVDMGRAFGGTGDWISRQYYDLNGFNSGRAGTEMYGPPMPEQYGPPQSSW